MYKVDHNSLDFTKTICKFNYAAYPLTLASSSLCTRTRFEAIPKSLLMKGLSFLPV